MKKKIQKKYIYEGLGFPIELSDVEMILIEDEWHPKIDIRKISDQVIEALALKSVRLTGNELKFIRTYFSMSLRDFAEILKVTHTAVNKWEKCGNKQTNMDINIEKILRLYIFEQTCRATRQKAAEFFKAYQSIKRISSERSSKSRRLLKIIKAA